jgi:hypothetical protein
MKIVIKCSDAPKEWCILEFQGTFDLGGKPLDGETIGTLTQNGVRLFGVGTSLLCCFLQ